MRRLLPQAISAAAFFGLVLVIIFSGVATGRGQVKAVATAVAAAGGADKGKAKAETVDYITFPSDRDAKQLLQAVIDYLKGTQGNEKWEQICMAAQRVLDGKSDSFYDYDIVEGDGTKRTNRISVKVKANDLIASFPKTGRQFYQLAFGPAAQTLLDDAIRDTYDRVKLADCSQRYFHTKAGAQATLLLAGLQLERGNYSEAAYQYERLFARPEVEDLLTPRTLYKAVVAFKRSGDQRYAEAAKTRLAEVEKKFPRDGLAIGRKTYTFDELKQELDRPVELIFSQLSDAYVSMRLGNASHTAVSDGGTPFLDPTFSIPLLYRTGPQLQKGNDWIRQNLDEALKRIVTVKKQPPIPGTFPVTANGLVIYKSYDGLYAVVTRDGFAAQGKVWKAGEVFWISSTERGLFDLAKGDQINGWWQFYQGNNMNAVLFDNPLIGSLAHDGTNVYFVDDMAIPQPPNTMNPDFGFNPNQAVPNEFAGIVRNSIMSAVNIETGKLLWSLGGPTLVNLTEEEEDKETNPLKLCSGSYFLGPPLPVNGKLYVLFERNGRLRLGCLDPSREAFLEDPNPRQNEIEEKGQPQIRSAKCPTLVWQQRIGEPITKMDVDSIRRMQCSYMAYADGVLICPTNSGAVVAVDVMSRSLLWAHSYRTREIPKTPQDEGNAQGQIMRIRGGGMVAGGAGGPETVLRTDRWRAAAPIISRGRVVLTAYDSQLIECVDLRTGTKIWKDNRDKNDLYVAGVINDKVLVVGEETCRAYDLMAPAGKKDAPVVWKGVKIGKPCGHGVAGKNGLYYIPVASAPETNQPEIWAIDVAAGKVMSRTAFRKKGISPGDDLAPLGNLTFHDGQVFAQTPREIIAFPLSELKRKAMDELLAKNPADPAGLTARGELLLDDGKLREAVADFKSAQTHNPDETTRRKIREKLYYAYTQMLKDDFSGAQPIVEEYKTLLEFPIDTDDPNEKQRLFDERLRRKALYICLMATGREKQGKLDEAFDFYRAFATLGDNKQLVPIYDEPYTQSRPDVWARGRIDRMIRGATDPAVRKPLEDRVKKEWEEVKAAADLNRLRTFVQVFGPYFAAGTEAEVLFADRLLATNTEDDTKEAEGHLLKLVAASDDKNVVARATETLARLLIRKRLFEDAIGLYTRLGTEFATVPIRDGKTGADYFAELLTDRRLLPYLEPTRMAMPGKVKIEHKEINNNRAITNGFMVEPDGDLLPFYRRFRLMIDFQSGGNNGTWTLIVTDKATGAERGRFLNLTPFSNPYGMNWGELKIAQANGHLLLLSLGHMSYCFDLAEKKELWRYNLLGAGVPNPNNQPQTELTQNGEMIITYEDGWRLRLGRSSILQPGYASLLTRDGLVTLDPATGNKLWAKSDVSPRAQVFGDAKHIYLIETGENGKQSSRVLRAVDGAPVPDVPAFGELLGGPDRVRMYGRLALIHETEKKDSAKPADKTKLVIGKIPNPFGSTPAKPGNQSAAAQTPKVLRLYDPLTGKNVWSKNYEAGSVLLHTFDNALTGEVRSDGRFEVIEALTGKVLFEGKTDADKVADHVKGLQSAQLLADGERYYLLLNNNRQSATRINYYYGYTPIRWVQVTGAVYCIEKMTGKRLWILDHQFENLSLVLDRFDELPVIVAANYVQEDNNGGIQSYRVAVVDKKLGKLRFVRNLDPNGYFMAMVTDPKTGATEFIRNMSRLIIKPDDGTADPVPDKSVKPEPTPPRMAK